MTGEAKDGLGGTGTALPVHWQRDVLGFWFQTLGRSDWFAPRDEIDREIARRFGALHAGLARSVPLEASKDAAVALAAVVVLDQFPRNMFRGEARAFETDAHARGVVHSALAAGLDHALATVDERLFLYLPLEHSEDLTDQEQAVALISALGDADYARYAIAHRDVIARFGRFPHRNAILGRASTPAEVAYLAQPGSGF